MAIQTKFQGFQNGICLFETNKTILVYCRFICIQQFAKNSNIKNHSNHDSIYLQAFLSVTWITFTLPSMFKLLYKQIFSLILQVMFAKRIKDTQTKQVILEFTKINSHHYRYASISSGGRAHTFLKICQQNVLFLLSYTLLLKPRFAGIA